MTTLFQQFCNWVYKPTKVLVGPRSGLPLEILATGSSTDQGFRVSLLDHLTFIGMAIAPGLDFRLHETKDDTYTLNKRDIYLCLCYARFDIMTLTQVFLHELCHSFSKQSQQHDKQFRDNLVLLTNKAKDLGYYTLSYRLTPQVYCGKVINF